MRFLDWLPRRSRAQPSLGVAAIALASPVMPAKHVLALRLREALPQLLLRNAESRGDLLCFALGDAQVSLSLLRTPLSARQRERLQARTPQAAAQLERHTAHLIVTVNVRVTEPSQCEQLLHGIVLCVAALSPACGVWWGAAPTLHPPEERVPLRITASRSPTSA